MGPRRKKDKGADGGGGGERVGPGLNAAAASAVAGAVAGAVARVVVGPLDVLKIRFQVQLEPIARAAAGGARAAKYWSLRQAVATIAREEGIQVRWRG
jgi:solute carrier family 25 thiamine pyrophosphate transporter 19